MRSFVLDNSRIYLFALLFVSIGIYGVFKPVNFPFSGERESLAQVVSITNVLRIKEAGNIAWTVADSLRTLRDGDYVFTSDDSKARIKYFAGVEIELSPNTLLEIRKRENELDLKIGFGLIKVSILEKERKINLSSRNEKLQLKSKNSGISVFELDDQLRVDVLKGSASVSNSTETISLKMNQSAVVKSNKFEKKETQGLKSYPEDKVKNIYNVIDSPDIDIEKKKTINEIENISVEFKNNKIAYSDGKFKVDFYIKNSGKPQKLIISAYPDMTLPFKIIDVAGQFEDEKLITAYLNDIGKYYWTIGKEKGTFTIGKPQAPIVPKVPKSQDLEDVSTNVEKYRFRWDAVKFADHYEVEIFTGRNIDQVFRKYKSTTNEFIWEHDAVDSYLFRVRAVGKWGQKSEYSNPGKIISPISPFSIDSKK